MRSAAGSPARRGLQLGLGLGPGLGLGLGGSTLGLELGAGLGLGSGLGLGLGLGLGQLARHIVVEDAPAEERVLERLDGQPERAQLGG